jgi:hypothetical protein
MPNIDLGTIPDTHSFMITESQQIYYVPRNEDGNQVFVRYSTLFPKYYSRNPGKRFGESALGQKGITY